MAGRRRRGFSLSELVVSILILSTLSVVLVGVIPATVFGMRSAGHRAGAAMLAREVLEDLRRAGYGQMETADLDPVTANGMEFTGDVAVEPARTPLGTNFADSKSVTVTLHWTERNQVKTYCTSTVFFRQ